MARRCGTTRHCWPTSASCSRPSPKTPSASSARWASGWASAPRRSAPATKTPGTTSPPSGGCRSTSIRLSPTWPTSRSARACAASSRKAWTRWSAGCCRCAPRRSCSTRRIFWPACRAMSARAGSPGAGGSATTGWCWCRAIRRWATGCRSAACLGWPMRICPKPSPKTRMPSPTTRWPSQTPHPAAPSTPKTASRNATNPPAGCRAPRWWWKCATRCARIRPTPICPRSRATTRLPRPSAPPAARTRPRSPSTRSNPATPASSTSSCRRWTRWTTTWRWWPPSKRRPNNCRCPWCSKAIRRRATSA